MRPLGYALETGGGFLEQASRGKFEEGAGEQAGCEGEAMSFTSAKCRIGSASRVRTAPPRLREADGDELKELALTFRQTVERLSAMMQELETAHRDALQAEVDKKKFYREVICAVTNGRFELVDREEVPSRGRLLSELPAETGPQYALVRRAVKRAALETGMDEERADDLVLAVGEAVTNAMKHAHDGCCEIYRTDDSLIVRICDLGTGIKAHDLPAAILMRGFSTKVSLGMGYTLMLQLCDRLWLSTGPQGTIVQLEKKVVAPVETGGIPLAVLEQL